MDSRGNRDAGEVSPEFEKRDPRYLRYFELFREEKFFEAHEVLEALWRETKGAKRDFYQGLIQLAAALVHYQKGNLTGAKELFKTASRYLEPYGRIEEGVRLDPILKEYTQFLEIWSRHPDKPELARTFLPRVGLYRYP